MATTLQAGDIAIIGANFDNPDKISFVVLTDIDRGTEVKFTDNGVRADGTIRPNEGTWAWATEQAISAGTVITIDNAVATLGTVSKSGSLAFSGSGDQIVAYQDEQNTPNFIYAVNSESSGWQADATSSNTSALPTGLINGETAVALNEVDNFAYTGTTTGSKAELLAAISNSTNWTGNNSTKPEHISNNFIVDGSTPTDLTDPTNPIEPTITLIHDIQGEGSSSTMVGEEVSIEAVITAYTPGLNGFYVQEQATEYDLNANTSEGIFVYYGNNDLGLTMDSIGDTVTLTGQVKEFYDNTQISYTQNFKVAKDGTIADLPEPTIITLPTTDAFNMESVEGMYVTVKSAQTDGELVVTETYNLGRYGEVVLTSDEVQVQFTETNTPNAASYAEYEAELVRDRIIIEDANTKQNPENIIFGRNGEPLSANNTLRGGDAIDEVSGVVGYSFGNYKVQTINGKGYEFTGEERPTAEQVESQIGDAEITVASANLLNFFTTIGKNAEFTTPYGNTQQSRGAENQEEYDRQLDKLVSMIQGLDADVVGLMEIQNNGYGKDSALKAFVDAINAKMGAGTYDYIKGPFNNGNEATAGDDAIMVGMIYKPANVTPFGSALVPNTKDYPAFANGNRVPLAQAFKSNEDGEIFTSVVNHFKSKGSVIDADQGDGQGNNPITRLDAAKDLQKWLDTDPTGTGDTDNLLIGDFNGYTQEDALQYLENNGYDHLEHENYSYVYKGVWGNLDHALASDSLAEQVTGVATWQINADEPRALDYNTNYQTDEQKDNLYANDPYRASDHNPVLIGLNLNSDKSAQITIDDVIEEDNIINIQEAPSVTISGSVDNVEDGQKVRVTITDNDGNIFAAVSDIVVNNGKWSLETNLRNSADGELQISAYVEDKTGNQATISKTISKDTVAPIAELSALQKSISVNETTTVTFTLSEKSADFTIDDIYVEGGTLSNFTTEDGIVYTATLTPNGSTESHVTFGARYNSYSDLAGNNNEAVSLFQVYIKPNTIVGTEGRDKLVGTENDDVINALAGNDKVKAGSGNDEVHGGLGHDRLNGNIGNDTLDGGDGYDWLIGGRGDDILIGGLGADLLKGGTGKDTFVFNSAEDTSAWICFSDVIQDFEKGTDAIDLSAIDANTGKSGDQTFSLTNNWYFTEAGQLLEFNGILYGNTDKDGFAEFAINLNNVTNLQASDFIL